MPADPLLGAKDVAKALNRSERDVRTLARKAMDRPDSVKPPMLRDRTTDEPITDKDGMAYVVVTKPPPRPGKPAPSRGEEPWRFLQVEPSQRVTQVQRYLIPGNPMGRGLKFIDAIAAAAGIVPGAPVRALDGARPGEPVQVISADSPGPLLGMLMLPEGRFTGWRTTLGYRVEVMVKGTLLLPAEGPIGYGPGRDRLLWDLEALCWRGEPVEGRRLLELRGNRGLDMRSEDGELAVVLFDAEVGLRLE